MHIMTKDGWRPLPFPTTESAKVERINPWDPQYDREHPTRTVTTHRPVPVKWVEYGGARMSETAAKFADKMWQEVLESRARRNDMAKAA